MPGQRVAFNIAKKKEAIIWIRVHDGGVASRAEAHFRAKGWRVSAATLRERWRNRDAIEDTHGHRKRLDGARRKPLLVHVGGILFDLVIERQSRKKNVSREWIAETAMALFDETGNSAQRCVASDNWVTRFMMAFIEERKPDMDPARVIMMNETAVFFEDPRPHTVNQRGARRVVMR
ncbi:hypothetical protein PC123_g19282 [Phytophthora cactorum]|nr:hypothetical protein PC123_g19282 [Phytophthora cactorum]